jgi:mono/diheme cytochrome c family protein
VIAIRRLNVALLVAFVLSIASLWVFQTDDRRPNVEFFPDMAHSPRYAAFAPNPNFADGQTLQMPPPGTIARGHRPLGYAATPEDAARAGRELTNPVAPGDESVLARGEKVFETFCTPCHGAGARGDGLVAQRGFPPPPSLLADKAVALADGQIFHILTYGQNNMASYASQISREDRWRVIRYVRSLQATAQKAAAPAPGGRP